MTCGSDKYPKTKYKTVRILNNYHVSNELTRYTALKEEVSFTQTNRDTKTYKTKIRGDRTVYIALTQTTGPKSVNNCLRNRGVN